MFAASLRRGSLAVLVLWVLRSWLVIASEEAATEGTCPAGSTSPECQAPGAVEDAAKETGSVQESQEAEAREKSDSPNESSEAIEPEPEKPKGISVAQLRVDRVASLAATMPQNSADPITQEVQQLEEYIKICEDRIRLLEELQSVVGSGHNISLPEAHMRALTEKLPLVSELEVDANIAPIGSSEDYYVTKAIVAQDDAASFVKFMPLRSPGSQPGGSSSGSSAGVQSVLPSALIITASSAGAIRIFTPSGELVHTLESGHEEPVMFLSVSQSIDEHVVATADVGGVVRLHKVSVKQRKHTKDRQETRGETKVSQFLGSQVNVTSQFERKMAVPIGSNGEPAKLTALAMATQSGARYVVAGDAEGTLSIFTKNGTLKSKVAGTNTPGSGIEGLFAHTSSLIFWAGTEWGFVELDKAEVRHMDCSGFEGRVITVAVDSQTPSRIIVASEGGTVAVLNARNKKECRVEHHFAKGAAAGAVVGLGSTRGFTIMLEHADEASWSIAALNNSQVGRIRHEFDLSPSPVVWRRHRPAVRAWAFHRRAQQGDLLAVVSEDGNELEIAELLMSVYTPPPEDNFGDFKLPMVAVGIIVVLGMQYMRMNKGKSSASAPSSKDWEKEFKELRNKRATEKSAKKQEEAGGAGAEYDD